VAADPRAVDRRVGLAIAALAVAVGWTARAFPDVPGQKLGASTLPLIVAGGLLACGLLLMLRGRRAPHGPAPGPAGEADERTAPALGILAAIGLYLAGADALGYLVGVRWPRAIAGSVVAALAVHLAFYKLLKVPLPWGLVPVLY
jgi:putative tricarboxylic transport membrane protein